MKTALIKAIVGNVFLQLLARYLKRQKLINVVIIGFQNMFQITQVKRANLFDLLNQMKNWLN